MSEQPSPETPPIPQIQLPDPAWEHYTLYQRVRQMLFALPSFFTSALTISGVLATDLFTFNASLGATIEAQVADALNALRSTWDPDQRYTLYHFVRQPQTFPDVILHTTAPDQPSIILGIELKGWYVLAREKEPSFRYRVTPAVCAPWDLLAIYPWVLSQAVSGSPRLFQPFVTPARYAAEYRNWWWQYHREGKSERDIVFSQVHHFYPVKSDQIADKPTSDSGGNFGRLARIGIMDAYINAVFQEKLLGISLDAWQDFLSKQASS